MMSDLGDGKIFEDANLEDNEEKAQAARLRAVELGFLEVEDGS